MSTPTTVLDLARLMEILRECAGAPEPGFEDTALRTPFDDLGYDSLALLECASRIQRAYGVPIADEVIPTLDTPQDLLALVNCFPQER